MEVYNYIVLIVLTCLALAMVRQAVSERNIGVQEPQSLTLTQIRYKINTNSSICIKDRIRKNLCMYIYPIDTKSARINIPSMGIDRIHKCRLSLLSEIVDILDSYSVDAYDGNCT